MYDTLADSYLLASNAVRSTGGVILALAGLTCALDLLISLPYLRMNDIIEPFRMTFGRKDRTGIDDFMNKKAA